MKDSVFIKRLDVLEKRTKDQDKLILKLQKEINQLKKRNSSKASTKKEGTVARGGK